MNYKEVIESKYNREAWQKLLYDIFRNKISFWNTPSAVHVSSRLAKEALNLGKISLVDGESIAIYEVEFVICSLQIGVIWGMLEHLCSVIVRMKAFLDSHT